MPPKSRKRIDTDRYKRLVETSNDLIWSVDAQGRFTFVNDAAALRIYGYTADEMLGRPFAELMSADQAEKDLKAFESIKAGNRAFNYRTVHLRKDGSPVHLSFNAVVDLSPSGEVLGTTGTGTDVSDLVRYAAELEYQAFHDSLTGLPNRTLFADRLTQALARARRHQEPIAVLYADLDHLKRVNDTLGHTVGDLLLKQAALRFRSTVREEDTVARFGGDEFVILLSRVKNGSVAARVAEKLVARMNEPMEVGGHTLRVTTSVGVSSWPTDGDDAETLLKNADNALYQAKDQGRNTYRMFAPAMNERIQRRLSLEQSLVRAIATAQFSLVYQAQHDLRSPRVVGYEALLRWNHESLGDIPPATFVPLAEETRLIESIGDWVLGRALMDARRFPKDARLAVNVSAIQLRDVKFPARVAKLLSAHDFPAQRLELELTESATIADDESIISVLFELRRMGVRIAVDDFGTGYASLSYLRRLSVDMVKIDKSFIAGVGESPADSAIVLGIMGMAHGLNLLALAEGVETEAQRDFLEVAGCDIAQGYLLGRPLPIDDLGL